MNPNNSSVTRPSWSQRLLIGRHPRWTLIRLFILITGSALVFTWILLPIRVQGISMDPTYRNGAFNAINQWSYRNKLPGRGDVVGVRYIGKKVMLLKRIIGLPGERVAIIEGVVFIDGEPLDEPYVKKRSRWNRPAVQLGPQEYLVIGDNREMPIEQHVLREIDRSAIVGKVLF